MTHPLVGGKSPSRKKKRKPVTAGHSGSASATPASAPAKQVTFAPTVGHVPVRRVAIVEPPPPTATRKLPGASKVVAKPGEPLRPRSGAVSPPPVPDRVPAPRRLAPMRPIAPDRVEDNPDEVPPPPPPPEESAPRRPRQSADDVPPPPPPPPPEPEPLEGVPKTVKLPEALVAVRPVRTDLLNKTRRKSVELLGAPIGDARTKLNIDANNAAMADLYNTYYGPGGQKRPGVSLDALYNKMGTGKTDYGKVPVTDQDFAAFLKTPNTQINGQKVSAYNKALKEFQAGKTTVAPKGPADENESVKKGDYFHVHNLRADRKQDLKGRARRIIVNVNSQKAGLKVASGLNSLISSDPAVRKNLREYKIYLSKTPTSGPMKHDKLVIYYALDAGDADGTDTVGNRIAAKINTSVKPDDIDQGFAPFYSNVAPGLAWAEEPKYAVSSMSGSFTSTRSDIIKKVISSNATIASKEDFIKKVNEALDAAGVEPTSPHRHQVAQ